MAALVALVLRVLFPFRGLVILPGVWRSILATLYPAVEQARRESAELGRRYYDAERERHGGERRDIDLPGYDPEWFDEAMQPVEDTVAREGVTDTVLTDVAHRVSKEAVAGSRRTVLRAVENDPKTVGWARIATGRETCAFCLMMISRGLVRSHRYRSQRAAGLQTDTTTAVELWRQIEHADTDSERERAEAAMLELMHRWHTGCDCLVVPIFDTRNWPGRDQAAAALQLWKSTTKGKRGRDALNALRREVDNGRVDFERFAAAA
ncbi:VG15 protein [Lentzea flava]|uniref:VG15 protein n=1 Tax=Lentzea flava TaxID=103732 RepID=UPI00166FC1D5|nr:hypothetical protein [Lentzea flava]